MIKGILEGAFSYIKAFKLIAKHRLWFYVIVPGIITILLAFAILGTAWGLSDNISDWLLNLYPWEWGRSWLDNIARVFGGVFIMAFGFIIFKNIVLAITSPFMSMLSAKIEKEHLGGDAKSEKFSVAQFMKDLARGIGIALRNVTRELFFTMILFLLGLIPLFAPVSVVLIFLVQAYYAGFGNMDFTLERYHNLRGSVRFVRKNMGYALGSGTVFMLLLMTGIGFIFSLPLGTAGATPDMLKKLSIDSLQESKMRELV